MNFRLSNLLEWSTAGSNDELNLLLDTSQKIIATFDYRNCRRYSDNR